MKYFKKLSTLFIITSILVYLIEKLKPEREYSNQCGHDVSNLTIGLENKILSSVIEINTNIILETMEQHNFGFLNRFKFNGFTNALLSFVLIDLWMYWWHLMNHKIPFLWKFHLKHHEDESLNATSAVRFHPVEIIISSILRIFVFIPMGISKKNINIYEKILLPVISFTHSNIKIGKNFDNFIRKIIVSPEMHRIHHSNEPQEANSNYSSVLPYWDMIFKTYTKFPKKRVEFGIIKK